MTTVPTESTWPQRALSNHRPDEVPKAHVREDRRDLDQVADATAEELSDLADHPQHVQVAGRVVVEEGPVVEAAKALAGEILGPVPERPDVDAEAGIGQEVCDDEAEGEPQDQEDEDSARGVP